MIITVPFFLSRAIINFNFSFFRCVFSRFFFFFKSSFCEELNKSFLAEFGIDLSSLIKLKNIPPDVRLRLPFYAKKKIKYIYMI